MTVGGQKTILKALVLLFIASLVGVVCLGVSQAHHLRGHLSSAAKAFGLLEQTAPLDWQNLASLLQDSEKLADLEANLQTLSEELSSVSALGRPWFPLCSRLGWLPKVGADVQAAPHLLSVAQESAGAALGMVRALRLLDGKLSEGRQGLGRWGPDFVDWLSANRVTFEAARGSLLRAQQSRARVDAERLSLRTRALLLRFDSIVPRLLSAVEPLPVLDAVLGGRGPRTYLILAQNNHELRATGGFISGVGLLQIEGGRVTELSFQDSYAVDNLDLPHPAPPDPLRRIMRAGLLVVRDANWWPDFPLSARTVADLFLQDQGRRVDGVVAVDLVTLQLLVEATGEVQIPGYDVTVGGANLQQQLMTYWQTPLLSAPGREGTDWYAHRKDFAADLLSALLSRLVEQATLRDVAAMAQALSAALSERHLLVYLDDPSLAPTLRDLHWDGALRPSQGDYLMVVDSNVGFNKVNPNVEQTIAYDALLDASGKALVNLTLTYRHRIQRPAPACVHEARYGDNYADLMERCYWDYLRVYLPMGSEVIDVRGGDTPTETYLESGHCVVATFFLLETGGTRQIQISYRPAHTQDRGHYSLLVQKQPGTPALPLRLSFQLPPGVLPLATPTAGLTWAGDRAVWQGSLAQDLEVELYWRQ